MTVFIYSECTCVWVCFWMCFAFLFRGWKKKKDERTILLLQSYLFLPPLTGDAILDDMKSEVKVDEQHFHSLKFNFWYMFSVILHAH